MASAKAKTLGEGDCLDPEFVDRCVASAADMALLFVGASQERMLHELLAVRERMRDKLAQTYPTEIAALIAQFFVATVARCKVEIERATVGNSEAIQ